MVARSATTSIVSLRFTNVVSSEQQAEFPWKAPTQEVPRTLIMWSYADPQDVVEAHVLGLEADISGHEAFLLAQPTTRFQESTIDLIQQNFGKKEGNGCSVFPLAYCSNTSKKSNLPFGLVIRPQANNYLGLFNI